jgi:hypothetical protein
MSWQHQKVTHARFIYHNSTKNDTSKEYMCKMKRLR